MAKTVPGKNPAERAASAPEIRRQRQNTPSNGAATAARAGSQRSSSRRTPTSPAERAASAQELSRKRAQSKTSPGESASRANISDSKLRQAAESARRMLNPIKEGTSRGAIDAARQRASDRRGAGLGGMADRAASARKGWETRRSGGKK